MSAWTPPPEFDGYRLVRLLGEGGMGQVWLAEDALLERAVAIKFISTADVQQEARRRFSVEARAIARLQHPNVVTVHRVGEVQGRPYLVSEFVRGQGLDRLPLPLPWRRVLQVGLDLARGLTMAHRQGVVHRDIKPANAILSDDGPVKLLDFGIAKLLDGEPEAKAASPLRHAGEEDGGDATAALLDALEEPDSTRPVAVPALAADLTQPGVALGTPLYMAPEVWRGEPATFASDVYSLGALLYALCAGRPPHVGTVADLQVRVQDRDAAPLAAVAPGVDRDFAAVIDRCLRRDPQARFATANEVRSALAALAPETRPEAPPEGNPYRGLHAFEAEHRACYFGRDSEISALLERLSSESFVLVAGDSGVGKSSLCRAGVLPRLPEVVDRSRQWSHVTLVPGSHPVTALAVALAPHLHIGEAAAASLLVDDAAGLARELRRHLGTQAGLVIFIDQMEELVTLSAPAEAEAVVRALSWIASPAPGVRLLGTVRGDFLSRLAMLTPLADAVSRALYFLRPLSAERVQEAIVGPALARGVRLESPALVQALVESTAGSGGGLPLLQFALAQLWDARDRERGVITAASLEALGGVAGALTQHADDVVDNLVPAQRPWARRVLRALVTPDGTRARRSRAELAAEQGDAAWALDGLVRGRLVVARDTAGGATYEIAHEALIQRWGTLAGWLAEDADQRQVRGRLGVAAAEWDRLGRPVDSLWTPRQLAELRGLEWESVPALDRVFTAASRRRAWRLRTRRVAACVGVPLALVLSAAAVQVQNHQELVNRVDGILEQARAEETRAFALREQALGMRAEAFKLFDGLDAEAAERAWARAVDADAEVDRALAGVGQRLEAALVLDGRRQDVRTAFADVLLHRALLAEDAHRVSERDELLSRLALHDGDGHRRATWDAPATVSLRTSVPSSGAALFRYADGEGLAPVPVDLPAPLPWQNVTLPRGSYRLDVVSPGMRAVRFPFRVGRGERAVFQVDMVPEDQVPAGFVYIPPGPFLYGSTAADSLRKGFFHAVPLHPSRTGAFFIAEKETTFREWLEFLRALPPRERRQRLPRVDQGGFAGSLSVKQVAGNAWQLSFQPTTQAYVAREGEPVRYQGRARHVQQDWRNFPVSGIGVEDAAAYAAWLDRSGKVPGARLCSELEWERAARGADEREYPHGATLRPEDANFDDTYAKVPAAMGPDEVGSYPATRSPFGLWDMAGNVWEWTRSARKEGESAARGGSYYFDVNTARVSNRETPEPSFRDVSVGMRLCADVAPRQHGAPAGPGPRAVPAH